MHMAESEKQKAMPCGKQNNSSSSAEWKFLMGIFRAVLFWSPDVFGESWWFWKTVAAWTV